MPGHPGGDAVRQEDVAVITTSEVELRPMLDADLATVDGVWQEAFASSTEFPRRSETRSGQELEVDLARHRHLLHTDPDGSFVATLGGSVVGLAQAHRRGVIFGLAMLAVSPSYQDRGIGDLLLGAALEYARGATSAYVFSSSDPRALHRYVRAGFDLHPAVRVSMRADTAPPVRPPVDSMIRLAAGTPADLDLVDHLDDLVRGGTRRVDVEYWLDNGMSLLLHDDGGYALLGEIRLVALAASSEAIARALLGAVLAGQPDGVARSAGWIVAEQQWAIAEAARNRATIEVHGAVMTRGIETLPHPYIPNGLLA